MGIRFQGLVFLVGVVISAISLVTSRGCGRLFETGLFWLLAYSWGPQLGRGTFVINAVFHGLSLVLLTWLIDLRLRRVTNPARSKLSSAAVALVLYCLLMFVFFPIRECTI
jgi:hypothetical protein